MLSNSASSPTALLRAEHELILEVTGALDKMLGGGAAGGEPDYANIDRCIIFFRLYVDAYHHGKEEELLFPTLGEQGLPMEDGPIGMMMEEHVEGRSLVKGMIEVLDGARSGDAASLADLKSLAYDYSEMIASHIDKENNILFDMADTMIEGSDLVKLTSAYEDLAAQEMEGYSMLDLEALAQKILVNAG